jgi:cytochrome c biogenesis protein CcdA
VLFGLAGLTREQAFTVPFLTYLISVVISLLGGLIFISRTPRRALAERRERNRAEAARSGAAGSVGSGETERT